MRRCYFCEQFAFEGIIFTIGDVPNERGLTPSHEAACTAKLRNLAHRIYRYIEVAVLRVGMALERAAGTKPAHEVGRIELAFINSVDQRRQFAAHKGARGGDDVGCGAFSKGE